MRKLRLATFLSAFPLLLSSCFSGSVDQTDIFAKEKITGTEVLASLTVLPNSENRTAEVTHSHPIYGDLYCYPGELSLVSSRKEFVRETTNEIGIKSTYEDEYFFYEVKVTDFDRGCISARLRGVIENAIEGKDDENARILKEQSVYGVGVYVKRSLYEGKPSSAPELYRACALLGEERSYYYDGNGLFNIVSR